MRRTAKATAVSWHKDRTATCTVSIVDCLRELGGTAGPELDTALHTWTYSGFQNYIKHNIPPNSNEEAMELVFAHLARSCKQPGSTFASCSEERARERAKKHLEHQVACYEELHGDVTSFLCNTRATWDAPVVIEIVPVAELTFEKMLDLAGAPAFGPQGDDDSYYDWREGDLTYWELVADEKADQFFSNFCVEVPNDAEYVGVLEIRALTAEQEHFFQEEMTREHRGYELAHAVQWLHPYGPEVREAIRAGYVYAERETPRGIYYEQRFEEMVNACVETFGNLPDERAEIFTTLLPSWQGELEELAKHTLSISA